MLIRYADGAQEAIVYDDGTLQNNYFEDATFVLMADAANNNQVMDYLDSITKELGHSAQYYNFLAGQEPDDLRSFIDKVSTQTISSLIYGSAVPAMNARNMLGYYLSAIIETNYSTDAAFDVIKPALDANPGALELRDAVWILNNKSVISDFDPSLQAILKNAHINLALPEPEVNRVGERYQLLLAGNAQWFGVNPWGETISIGQAEVVGLLDTFDKKSIKVAPELLGQDRNDAWWIQADKLAQRLRDSRIVAVQQAQTLKSWYVLEKGVNEPASLYLSFDQTAAGTWQSMVSDSETAVNEYRSRYLPTRTNVLQDLMRYALNDQTPTITLSDAQSLYATVLTIFKDYIPHNIDKVSRMDVSSPAQYVTKPDEPYGYLISEATVRLLQAIKQSGITRATLTSGDPATIRNLVLTDSVLAKVAPDKAVLDKISQPNATPLALTPGSLAYLVIKAKLGRLYNRAIQDDEVLPLYAEIQTKYASMISYEEFGNLGSTTYTALSYITLAQEKNLFPAYGSVDSLPDAISYTTVKDSSGNDVGAFVMHKLLSSSSRMTATFVMNGNIDCQIINGKNSAAKSYAPTELVAKNYFGADDFAVNEAAVASSAYADTMGRIHLPSPGSYNEWCQWQAIEKIATSIVVSMVTGNVLSFLGNVAGIQGLVELYNTAKNIDGYLKAAASKNLESLLTNYLGSIVPRDWIVAYQNISGEINSAVQYYQDTENYYKSLYRQIEMGITANLQTAILGTNQELFSQVQQLKQQFEAQKAYYQSTLDNLVAMPLAEVNEWKDHWKLPDLPTVDLKIQISNISKYQKAWIDSKSDLDNLTVLFRDQDLFRLIGIKIPPPSCGSSKNYISESSYYTVNRTTAKKIEMVNAFVPCITNGKMWDKNSYKNCDNSVRSYFATHDERITNDEDLYQACLIPKYFNKNLSLMLSLAADDTYNKSDIKDNDINLPADPFRTLKKEGFAQGVLSNFTPLSYNGIPLVGMQAIVTAKHIEGDLYSIPNDRYVVAIGFRGSDDYADWYDNGLKAVLRIPFSHLLGETPSEITDTTPIVHGGFAGQILSFLDLERRYLDRESNIIVPLKGISLRDLISRKESNVYYLVFGHSLGGALANLYGATLKERGIADDHILIYAFEDPGIGNTAMINKFRKLRNFSFRNRSDLVPLIPYAAGFSHISNRLLFYEGSSDYWEEPGMEELVRCPPNFAEYDAGALHVASYIPQAFADWGGQSFLDTLSSQSGGVDVQGCTPSFTWEH